MSIGRVVFSGGFLEYFLISVGFIFLTAITFGILFPAWVYWSVRYFSTRIHIERAGPAAVEDKGSLVQ